MTSATLGLMWCVLGHQDHDYIKDGKCGTCGSAFAEWREKVRKQGGAVQGDCCKGFVLNKPSGQ